MIDMKNYNDDNYYYYYYIYIYMIYMYIYCILYFDLDMKILIDIWDKSTSQISGLQLTQRIQSIITEHTYYKLNNARLGAKVPQSQCDPLPLQSLVFCSVESRYLKL